MTVRAARVLAFPGIDLETLAKLRARACDAFMREDVVAYQEACMMMRKLIGGQDVSETGARFYRHRERNPRQQPLPQGAQDRLSAKLHETICHAPKAGMGGRWQPGNDGSPPA